MSIVRIPNKKKNYAQISNEVLNDKNLSYEALGLLVHLLSKPLNWKVIIPALIREGKNGKTQIYGLLLDLQIAGHLVREPCRTDTGRLCGYHYIAYEAPQVVNPPVLKKLVAQRDAQKQRRMINNRRQAAATKRDHPDLANPDTVHPDLDGRPPTKERDIEKKEEKKKTPNPAEAGYSNSFLSFPEGSTEGLEVVTTAVCPEDSAGEVNSHTEIPEDSSGEPVGETEVTVASLPVLAADAARENPEKRPQGALPGPRDPVFPKNEQGHPDWCAAVRQFDHDNAVLMNQIWRADLFRDSRLARKYYNARRNGHLPEREIQLISRFWADAPIDGDKAPRTLWDALDYANYSTVVSACRAAVREAIGAIRDDGETDDGEMHTLQCIAAARGRVRADTDMVELLSTYPNYVGPLFVGYSLGAQKLAEAQVKYREQIIEELCKWPSLLSCWQEPADFPKILGLSLEEIREHQQRHAEEKARCIAELTPFLQ